MYTLESKNIKHSKTAETASPTPNDKSQARKTEAQSLHPQNDGVLSLESLILDV